MSMNLYIEVDGSHLSVYQTPTHITNMCLMNYKPEVRMTGKNAQRAVRMYLEYVKGTMNGVFDSAESAQQRRDSVMAHVKEVEQAVANAKRVVVYTI